MENKQTVQKRIEEIMPDLRELSDYLWHHPESDSYTHLTLPTILRV